LEDLKKHKLTPKLENLELYELLHQYRAYIASYLDECPDSVFTVEQLVALADKKHSTSEELELFTSSFKKKFQVATFTPTLLRIINERYTYMTRINNVECHNCQNKGHVGLKIMCPYPKNPHRVKEYMKEHPEHKAVQVKRRNKNRKKNAQLRKATCNVET